MAELFFADLVRETSLATGTGPIALAGAAPGHRRFADAGAGGATFHYAIAGVTHSDQWETGEGQLAGDDVLVRAPIASSAGGAAVDFLPGLKTVVLTVGAAWFAGQQQALAGKADLDGAEFAGAVSATELVLSAPLALGHGGTGAAGAAAARANLQLGSAALEASAAFLAAAEKGAAGGVATLDGAGKVPAAQLPAAGVSSVNGQSGAVTLTAGDIGSNAAGDIAATNVQAAIAELASEKAALSGAAFSGAVTTTGQAAVGGPTLNGTYKLSVNADNAGISVSTPTASFATPAISLARGAVIGCVTPTSSAFEIGTQSSTDIVFKRGSSERFRVQSAGIAVVGSTDVSVELRQGGTKVVGARATGWSAASGTAARTTFATGSATTTQIAERLKALIDDLIGHGLIGA
ncbi:MAG TPA: hypothetical protein VEW25_06660 [Allosphingosinicella sp.]|nr:hypothetical protein [Allosphingosinicella sp.]